MKAGRVAIVGVLFIAMLAISGANADKPEGQGKLAKPPSTSGECIVFTGDLAGKQIVEGCCPNAGPFPEYTMTLSEGILEDIPGGEYDGNVFMNYFGAGRTRRYIVQFWTPNDEPFLEVRGGVIREATKDKLTVEFIAGNYDYCWDYSTTRDRPCFKEPTFTLVRTSNLNFCK
jgi:hypothetical protein